MSRPVTDRCPGLVRPHLSADGALVRLRLPGGQLPAAALQGLIDLAERYGDGAVQLTSRANLQIRGIAVRDGVVDDGLALGIEDLGLNPAPSHELVRNIAASPLTGWYGGVADVRPLVRNLDASLRARPALANLPGRFLFGIDDGRGDVDAAAIDLGLRADDGGYRLLIGTQWTGQRYDAADGVRRVLDLAERFVAVRGGAWRVAELPDGGAELGEPMQPRGAEPARPLAVGTYGESLVVMPRLGRLDRDQVEALTGALTPQPRHRSLTAAHPSLTAADPSLTAGFVLTPGRQIVIPGAAAYADELALAGLISDPRSPWTRITACAGAPGCANAHFQTAPRAAQVAAEIGRGEYSDGLPVHITACDRRCGTPTGAHHGVGG